ncbi:MAG: tetratricopeptide repeat protein [Magnetococcales bacterium]|nr:tetratricopeptide repeat protein [Magnetococcales bacterium]MBF0437557.1 tetratricopeptide repeat protein [Magnetococcales bacterium]
MTWLWTLPILLIASLAGVFYPVFTQRGGSPLPVGLEGDPHGDLAAQRDGILMQLKEMEMDGSDTESGPIRNSLEMELATILTRLDAMEPLPATGPITTTTPRTALDISIALSVMLLITVLSGGLYVAMGTPGKIAPATAEATQAIPAEIAIMVEQAAIRMQATPDDLAGWMRLARSYVVINRPDEAMNAYTHILSRHPDALEAAVALSELQIQNPNLQLQEQAIKRFEEILAKKPDQTEALWFLGGAAFRSGDKQKALTLWTRLMPLLPPGSPALKTVEQAIGQLKKP